MRIRKSCGVSELRILVTKSLHGESAFDDFERLGSVNVFAQGISVIVVVIPTGLKRLRGLDEFPASSGERFQGGLLQTELTFVRCRRGRRRARIRQVGWNRSTVP